jgi:hypothetical protein
MQFVHENKELLYLIAACVVALILIGVLGSTKDE